MAEKKKILYIVEAMGGGVFTYIVDQVKDIDLDDGVSFEVKDVSNIMAIFGTP